MPRDFAGIIAEHRAVRETAGLFDISHMGRFVLRGEAIREKVEKLFTRELSTRSLGTAVYGFFCAGDGEPLDDDILYLRSDEEIWGVVNAANRRKVFNHLQAHLLEVELEDRTTETTLFALQGPAAEDYFDLLKPAPVPENSFQASWFDRGMVATTGYTGEPGCEIWLPVEKGKQLFARFKEAGVQLCGLGARDSLRLEMGYPLHGHELNTELDPVNAGFEMFIDWDHEFLGRETLQEIKNSGPRWQLQGLVAEGRRSPRAGQDLRSADSGEVVGEVTSGGFSPLLNRGIAIGKISASLADSAPLEVEIREKWYPLERRSFPLHQ